MNIIIGVIDIFGIEFFMIVYVYLEFCYEIRYENGIINNRMMGRLIRNVVNDFIIFYN